MAVHINGEVYDEKMDLVGGRSAGGMWWGFLFDWA
jgi:hypothetical protein